MLKKNDLFMNKECNDERKCMNCKNEYKGNVVYGAIDMDRMIKNVYFNEAKGTTVVKWLNGTTTKVKCQYGEPYDKEKGFAMCLLKYMCGNTGKYFDLFTTWCGKYVEEQQVDGQPSNEGTGE